MWTCHRIALGSGDGTAALHVAEDRCCSSLLETEERHLVTVPNSRYVGVEEVRVSRLDSIAPTLFDGERLYLKLDVQGGELGALRGSVETLHRTEAIEVELSLVSLYRGAPAYEEVIAWLADRGFRLATLDAGFESAHTGEMLQFDGIFVRSAAPEGS